MSRERSLSWASPAFGAIRPIGSWWANACSLNCPLICLSGAPVTSTHYAVKPRPKPLPLRVPPPTSTANRFCYIFRKDSPMRPSRRAPDELRPVSLERGVVKYAEGSCMVKFGDTHVLVTATLEERLPPWLKGQGRGWVTAEYGMLPRE